MAILIICFLCLNQGIQQTEKTTATFDGYEEGAYYFFDNEGYIFEFFEIESKVLKKYDLKSGKYDGKTFEISIINQIELNEDDEEYTVSTIVDLKLID